DEYGVLATATVSRGRRHGESIAPAVSFVCERAGVRLDDVHGVVADVGPGLFTGLRVGLATAKALAFALDVPLATATSLEVLAHGAAEAQGPVGPALLVPVVDARRGEVFSARYRVVDGAAEPDGDERLMSPEALAAELAGQHLSVLCMGDGARRYRDLLGAPHVQVAGESFAAPDVAVLGRLGVARLLAGDARPAGEVTARYLREADVRINWEQRIPPRPAVRH
ncbi:MAG TPA: tRNA (adenosine(37)-N6)-threonylcarbamoyltransferase complex dimerization subunit type 1 TsaB, partial [Acidimicrobiales bacterium]|nr:tRNA (adenosine(37)-N6)-threonylcarbamoyltransferase complex dimerization subunit type 1 TsaB [Acidimicrobiales bacterium]